MTFLKSTPQVETIARDTRYFTYMRDCPPQKQVFIGDGRIGLQNRPDARYGLIILDAFSSDAIPMHMLTREAIAMDMRKLQPGGLLLVHISNRHLDLLPVMSAIAADLKLSGVSREDIPPADMAFADMSEWVVLAADSHSLALLRPADNWNALPQGDPQFLWRDDYSNLLRSIYFSH